MVDLQDIMYWGSVTIRLDNNGNLVGTALVKLNDGSFPIELTREDLLFVESYSNIMNSLRNGNVIYITAGSIYLGRPVARGAYGEEKLFISEVDDESLIFIELFKNLDYKVSHHLGRKKELVKLGDYYLNNKKGI